MTKSQPGKAGTSAELGLPGELRKDRFAAWPAWPRRLASAGQRNGQTIAELLWTDPELLRVPERKATQVLAAIVEELAAESAAGDDARQFLTQARSFIASDSPAVTAVSRDPRFFF